MQPLTPKSNLSRISELEEDIYNDNYYYKEARKLKDKINEIIPQIFQIAFCISLDRAEEILRTLEEEDELLDIKNYPQIDYDETYE